MPLRCLRDAILLNATRAGENAREVEELFTLVDGVVALCHALQSRGAPGPYESVERAVRLRLFLCVAGESWKDHPGLRARAVRKLRAFAVQEAQEADHEKKKEALRTSPAGASGEKKPALAHASASFSSPAATPGRVTTVVAKDAASAPSRLPRTSSTSKTSSKDRSPAAAASFFSRRAPSSVHAAVDVSSWRAVYAELAKVPPSRMMPVVSALLDDLREVEEVESARTKAASSFELPAGSTPKTLLGRDGVGPERETERETSPSRVASLHEPGVPATPAAVPAGWHRFDAPTPGSSGRQSHPQSLKTHVPGSNPERDEFDALMKRFATNA